MSKQTGIAARLLVKGGGAHDQHDGAVRHPARRRVDTVLLANGLAANQDLIQGVLGGGAFRLLHAKDARDVLRTLSAGLVDLVILPGTGELGGLECCRRIKADRRTELVPVLMMTGAAIQSQIEALSAGADDFLPQPFHPDLARTRIHAMLRHKAATDRLEQTEAILFALAQAVELRDPTTGGHCDRLGLLSLALGIALGLTDEDLEALYRGGYLHDIGKIGMPDNILSKPGPLNEQEWETMRVHPLRGEEICKPLRSVANVLPIIRHHHERWDGSGYPDGLKGEKIPLLARVLQLADIYDALTNERPYKKALPAAEALEVMQQETDRGWRDPVLMNMFTRLHQDTVSTETWRDAKAMQESLRNLQAHLSAA